MKRILALFLGILFLFSALPISVFAEGTKDFADTVNEEEYIDITKLTKISYEDALSEVKGEYYNPAHLTTNKNSGYDLLCDDTGKWTEELIIYKSGIYNIYLKNSITGEMAYTIVQIEFDDLYLMGSDYRPDEDFYKISLCPSQLGNVIRDSYSGDTYICVGVRNDGTVDAPKVDISLEKGEHIMISELWSGFGSYDYLPAAIFDVYGNAICTSNREITITLTKVPGTPVGGYSDTLIVTDTATGESLYYDVELIVEKDVIGIQIHVENKIKDYGSSDPEFTYNILSGRLDYEPIVSVTLEREPGEEPGDYEIICTEAVLHNDISNEYQEVSITTCNGNLRIKDDPMSCGEDLKWSLLNDGTLVISGTGAMNDYSGTDTPWYSIKDSVKSVVIEEGVTTVGNYAFFGCSSLVSVTIPESVAIIGENSFSDCTSLTSITVPDSVVKIGTAVFSGCSKLNSITIPFVGESRKTPDDTYQYPLGYIFGTSKYGGSEKTEQAYHGATRFQIIRTTYYIPTSLKQVTVMGGEILKGAFENCDLIASVILENDVTGIGEYAFNRCTSLMSITIGDGVTNIADGAFSYCTSLQNITLPESVTSISDNAFEGCDYIAIKCNCGSEAFYYAKRKNLSLSWTCTEQLNNYVYNNDATCTEDGTKTAVCDICETPRTLKADNTALGHSFTNYASDNNATCIEDGTKTKKCRRCDTAETITDENSALGHLFNNYFRNEDATCTADGTMTSKCFRCDAINTIVDKGSALGHTAGEWQITKEPELGVEGEKVKCCTVCNEILETDSIPALIKEMTFTDVKAEHWYYNAVEYCFMEGIINGVGDDKFAPQTELSRAMLVRILWNMEGCPEPSGDHFTDIGTDRWYTDAVNWAAENGIVAGMDSEHFCPEKSITREQLAAIMQRYSSYLGNDVSARADLNNYVDADKISDWAYESLEWAVSVGIISGRSETTLVPKSTSTRAETAQIIFSFTK